MTQDYKILEYILKATSKAQVMKLCRDVFSASCKSSKDFPDVLVQFCVQTLAIMPDEAVKLIRTMALLFKRAVFQGTVDQQEVEALFPDTFHKNLRDLLAKIIIDNMDSWKSQVVHKQVSLPKLVDFDWCVSVKTASDTVARMSVPTCILSLQVSGDEEERSGSHQTVNVELSKETLDTMLDGLSKIRDQLSSVAKR